jgi:DNA repair protein RecN (Recombination protein N)
VAFYFSANPGEAPGPLARIASGGELSRFMLAVKRVIAERDPVPVYVFDEVDTGVSGPTAEAIGRKLQAVAGRRQALCITHLPQIAALGDHHLLVSKHTTEGRTHSRVEPLDRTGRVEELARMLAGAVVTKTARANARELLRNGRRTLV